MKTKSIENLFIEVLSGTASSLEKKEVTSWINQSKENRKTFEQFKMFWKSSGKAYNSHEFDMEWAKEKIISKLNQKRSGIRNIHLRIAAAASVILLVGLSFLIYFQSNQSFRNGMIYSATNQVKEILLPDSSHVWLNKNSTLKIEANFGIKHRKAVLEGEAYFEVKRDETKPFEVLTGNTLTRVLGTSFNIFLDKRRNVTLTVNSGKVEFNKKYKLLNRQIYTAGDIGLFQEGTGKVTKEKNRNLNYIAWKTGILNFQNTPLDEVCNTLSKHYGKVITTSIPESDFSLTATYSNETLENIIATICITLDIETTAEGNTIVLYQ